MLPVQWGWSMLIVKKVWLEKERSTHAKLESSSVDCLFSKSVRSQRKGRIYRLLSMPSLLLRILDMDIRWSYIINLDQEMFTVNWGAHFKLSKIPRENYLWLEALREDDFGRQTMSTDTCPAESIGDPIRYSDWDTKSLSQYRCKFKDFSCSIVRTKKRLDPLSNGFHGEVFLSLMFVAFSDQYRDYLTRFALEWSSTEFVFREIAFAIVSLASGQTLFYSIPPQWYLNSTICTQVPVSGGILGLDQSNLPQYIEGNHQLGEQPGSAPLESV